MGRPIIAITMGDGAGIGAEVIIKALAERAVYDDCIPVIIGDARMLRRIYGTLQQRFTTDLRVRVIAGVDAAVGQYGQLDCLDLDLLPADLPLGKVSTPAGNAAYQYIARAVELAQAGRVDGICTAPLNKAALQLAGHMYPGHTEILAHLTATTDYSMMLSAPGLKVIHLTTHVGLIEAIRQITPERTYTVLRLAHDTLFRAGYKRPRIAVCGINPHAGENGLFGEGEEEEKLLPGIEKARAQGLLVDGPLPADTLFYLAKRGDYDIVVACYHDQGHIPVKVLGIEDGVNITVGLKGGIIRTSVDHGTAFDIAGTDQADPRSMIAALRAAVELAPRRYRA